MVDEDNNEIAGSATTDVVPASLHSSNDETSSSNAEPVPHAEAPAEAVLTAAQISSLPMAAAVLIGQPSKINSPTADDISPPSATAIPAAAAIPQHNSIPPAEAAAETETLSITPSIEAVPHVEATELHDELNTSNVLESALPSLDTTIMHVEMDGELGVEEIHGNTISQTSQQSPRQCCRCSLKRGLIACGMVSLGVLISGILSVVIVEDDDGPGAGKSGGFLFGWSIQTKGLPPISSAILPVATQNDEIFSVDACYDFCDEVSRDAQISYMALAYFRVPEDALFDGRATCICYKDLPCLQNSSRKGVLQAAAEVDCKDDEGREDDPMDIVDENTVGAEAN